MPSNVTSGVCVSARAILDPVNAPSILFEIDPERVAYVSLSAAWYDHPVGSAVLRLTTLAGAVWTSAPITADAGRATAARQPFRLTPEALARAWVRPEVVVEVTYLTWTEDNLLRQVSYQGQREDKPAAEVVRSIPVATARRASWNHTAALKLEDRLTLKGHSPTVTIPGWSPGCAFFGAAPHAASAPAPSLRAMVTEAPPSLGLGPRRCFCTAIVPGAAVERWRRRAVPWSGAASAPDA
jgi:ATP dependent DNA ligase C terminal region